MSWVCVCVYCSLSDRLAATSEDQELAFVCWLYVKARLCWPLQAIHSYAAKCWPNKFNLTPNKCLKKVSKGSVTFDPFESQHSYAIFSCHDVWKTATKGHQRYLSISCLVSMLWVWELKISAGNLISFFLYFMEKGYDAKPRTFLKQPGGQG